MIARRPPPVCPLGWQWRPRSGTMPLATNPRDTSLLPKKQYSMSHNPEANMVGTEVTFLELPRGGAVPRTVIFRAEE